MVLLLLLLLFFGLFVFSRAIPAAYGGSQAQPMPGDLSHVFDYTTAHSNARSLTHWERPGINPSSSWILVRFVSAEPWWELPTASTSDRLLSFQETTWPKAAPVFFFFFLIFIDVQLIYNVNFFCTSKWFSYTYTYIFFFIFCSTTVCLRILNIAPVLYSRSMSFILPI